MALAFVPLLSVLFLGALVTGTKRAEVKGMVIDAAGAGIMGASVVFVNRSHRSTVETAYDGTYSASLQPGTYEMYVRATGFYEMRRGAFTLHQGTTATFDFELLAAVISDSVAQTDSSQPRSAAIRDPYNYQEEYLNAISPSGLRPLVLFGKRKTLRNSTTFTGLVRDGKQLPVVYTYDLFTVKARSLTYFPKDNSVRGEGDVFFQEGMRAQRGLKVEISFQKGKPETKLSE
jgi:hypothetical protein